MATYREELEELRDLLLTRLKEASARDTAPIAARYADTIARLAAMDSTVPQEGSKLDELSAARERRRSGTASS